MNFKKIRSEIFSLVIIVVGVFAFKSTVISNYTVISGSMMPTIEIGDKLVINKMAYDFRIPFTKTRLLEYGTPKRGEVVVFECPYDSSMTFVKRLIGLPGDHIEIDHGFITINGKALKNSLKDKKEIFDVLRKGGLYQETLEGFEYTVRRVPGRVLPKVSVTVPEGHYFAVGDNRDESSDSRSWGFVPKENLWGKAKFIYFSFEWPKIKWNRIGKTFSK